MKYGRKVLPWLTGIVLIVGGLIWFFSSVSDTLNHIIPNRGIALSTDMRPYEVNLRLKNNEGKMLQWQLVIPRAFVIDETGANGDTAPSTGPNTGFYSAAFGLYLNENGNFISRSTVSDPNRLMQRMFIDISNSLGTSWIARNDLCVPQHLLATIAKKYNEYAPDRPCYDQLNACTIATQIDGWNIGVSVTKDLYSDPQHVCKMVKSFLNSKTTKRDIIPQ